MTQNNPLHISYHFFDLQPTLVVSNIDLKRSIFKELCYQIQVMFSSRQSMVSTLCFEIISCCAFGVLTIDDNDSNFLISDEIFDFGCFINKLLFGSVLLL
jgi:hypothetical protein